MKLKKHITLASAVGALSLASTNVVAQTQFDQVVVFGASYLDSGVFPDSAFGFATGLRFTNINPATGQRGQSLAELLTSDLGLGALPPATTLELVPRTDGTNQQTSDGNLNFAVGGFQTEQILQSIVGNVPLFGLGNLQGLNARIADGSFTVSENALFVVNLGGNDIRALDNPQVTAATALQSIQALADAGANTIVAGNLPNLGNLPEAVNVNGSTRTAVANARTANAIEFNQQVDAGIASINANIIRADIASLLAEVIANPTSFGFSANVDQTSQCFNGSSSGCFETPGLGNSSGGNPDDFIFDDGLHPTQKTAQISADYIESLLRAPSQVSLIAEAGHASLVQHQNSLRSHQSGLRFSPQTVGRYSFIANVQTSDKGLDETGTTASAEAEGNYLNVGFTYRKNNNWRLGASLAYVDQELDIASTGSNFESDGFLISGLANYQNEDFFAEASISYADLDIESKRSVLLGSTQRIESAQTSADGIGLSIAIGKDIVSSDTWHAGPILRFDFNQLNVDDFSENGRRSTSLSFSNIERSSPIAAVGAFANTSSVIANMPVQYFAEALFESNLDDDSEDVQASLNSLNNSSQFSLRSFEIDDNGYSVQLGVNAQITSKTSAQISYTYQELAGDIQSINIGVKSVF